MCGRVRLSSDVSEIKLVFSIPPDRPTPNFPPSWNVAPTDILPVVRYDTKAEQRSLDMLRWGLIPYWDKDIKVGFANINAKAEGIESKPAFRKSFERRSGRAWRNFGASPFRYRPKEGGARRPTRGLVIVPRGVDRAEGGSRPYASATARRAPIVRAAS